jgi:four helix bundle protein
MATVKKFEDLKVWQESNKLSENIFDLIISNRSITDFPLKDQMNRSSGSIMDNIAEGFGRGGSKEFRQFLGFSKGSCDELKSQLYRTKYRKYIDSNDFERLYNSAEEINKMINGLINYLNKTDYRGIKFKEDPELYITRATKTEN